MNVKSLFIIFFSLIFSGCNKPEYYQVEVENPPYKPNTVFKSSEDLTNPGFARLIEKYQLNTVFHGETDEFKRILLLRNWIKSVISINDFGDPYPGGGYVEGILDEALKGQGFHCGHFMRVQNGIMNAYGYVTRTIGSGPGVKGGPDGHHGINEIWLNDYNKWFLSDAKYDHHFEKNGIPLSALEVRDEYLKNKAADVVVVRGPERTPTEIDPDSGADWERSAQTYTWIEFHGYNDMFSAWPNYKELLIMYEDDFFKNNTWIWDDKPHWAYNKPEYMLKVQDRDAIEWTPNTIASEVTITDNKAVIKLISDTPNRREYQMKQIAGSKETPDENMDAWVAVEPELEVTLNERRHEFLFRIVNLAGVNGPEHKIVIEEK